MGLSVQDGDQASPRSKRLAEAERSKALRKVEWERRWLAAQMKWEFSPEERLDLFTQFGVPSDGKERKLQLVRRLWAPDTIRGTHTVWYSLLQGWCSASMGVFNTDNKTYFGHHAAQHASIKL